MSFSEIRAALRSALDSLNQADALLTEAEESKSRGGRARAVRMTPEARSEAAKKAAQARWSKP